MKGILAAVLVVFTGLAGCTDGNDGDRDGDSLSDLEEARGWMIEVETMTQRFTRHVTSDPGMADTDGDGVLDIYELAFGLDPNKADTDGDGLTDCQETRHTVREECEDAGFEGPTDGGYRTAGNLADSDASASRYVNSRPDEFGHRSRNEIGQVPRGDGLSDGDEVLGFRITLVDGRSRQVSTDPILVDTDNDGLEDAEERFIYGTDPTVPDTDGDACEDGFDMIPEFAERYKIELDSFTWTEAGRSGSTHVAFLMSIVDRSLAAPPEDPMKVVHGQETDVSGLSPESVTVVACTYGAREPWFRVDMQVAEFQDGAYVGPVDVHSETLPDGVSVWMNARTAEYRWDPEVEGGPAPGLLTWRGAEGEVRFQPRVVDA